MLSWLKKIFRKEATTESPTEGNQKIQVFEVIEGPHLVPDRGSSICLVVLYFKDDPNDVHCTDLYFLDFNLAYQFKRHIEESPDPVSVDFPLDIEIQEDIQWQKRLH